MQRRILALFLISILLTTCKAQWEILNQSGSLSAIDFVDSETGWIAGSGSLMKTEDGGLHWMSIAVNETLNVAMIDFINESTGWGISYDYNNGGILIIKTTDGGHNWIRQNNLAGYSVRNLFALDDTTVFVLGDTVLLKTSDGGNSWNDIATIISDSWFSTASFVNSEQGIIAGSKRTDWEPVTWKTFDGGKHWQETPSADTLHISDLQFCNDSTGYCAGITGSGQGVLCKTNDFGEHWSILLQNSYNINSLQCLNEDVIYCVVLDSTWSHNIMKSADGGEHWQQQQNPDRGTIQGLDLKFFSQQFGLIVADGSLLYRTEDGGDQWKICLLSYPFRDVVFVTKTRGFICGSKAGLHFFRGDFFITSDGGQTWSSILNGSEFEKCIFLNESAGFLSSWDLLYKTIDGGGKWTAYNFSKYDSTGVYFQSKDFCFTNEMTGWSAGSYSETNSWGAAIFKTVNGGENWNSVFEYSGPDPNKSYVLNSIFFLDENSGWAVGDPGLVCKYNYLSNKWSVIETDTDLPLNKVWFTDQENGWIGGGWYNYDLEYHPLLLKSANGGSTWIDQHFGYIVNDMYFSDRDHGWLVGSDSTNQGVILATRDGGLHWQIQIAGLSSPLIAIHFADDYGWAVGNQGLILKTENGGASWIADDPDLLSGGYNLDQNFPNPFNPYTTITFTLPIRSLIEINIYNIQGQKLATLINKIQNAGTYHLSWNASRYASGVYFYKMETPDFTQTRKMLLLR
jgi:photosystem II stability/assembly factor-like uncharacterized protein